MPCPEVEFRTQNEKGEAVHEYWLDGVKIPSVSYILASNGFIDYGKVRKSVMESARELGSAVHSATHYYDEDDLDVDTVDPKVRPFLDEWMRFRSDWDFKPLLIERPMSCCFNGMNFGMTPDRYGTCKLGNVVVDIKTTFDVMPSHQIQLAAYQIPFETDGNNVHRFVVDLRSRPYKFHQFQDRNDKRIFGAALALTHWKLAKGIK